MLTTPSCLSTAYQEITTANTSSLLSTPIKYDEALTHLPYTIACIKESLRLNPSAPNLFPRVVSAPGGKTILGTFLPPSAEILSNAYVVQRDPDLYAPDPEVYRPARWLESKDKAAEMEARSFVFGMGPRMCLGKDIALMELYKLIPEFVRRFDMELVNAGGHFVTGGVAYNQDFTVKLSTRE